MLKLTFPFSPIVLSGCDPESFLEFLGRSDRGKASQSRYFLLGRHGQTRQPLPLIGGQVVPRQKSVTVQKTRRSLSRRKARTVSGNGHSPWEAGGRVAGLNILFLSGGHRNTAREVLQRYVGQDAPSIATKLPTPQSAAVEARFVWLDGGHDYRRIARWRADVAFSKRPRPSGYAVPLRACSAVARLLGDAFSLRGQ